MKQLVTRHKHKFLGTGFLIAGLLVLASYTIWRHPHLSLKRPASRTAVIQITSSGQVLPSTLAIKKGTQVVWQNQSQQTVKLNLQSNAYKGSQILPNSSYSLMIDQPGTITYSLDQAPQPEGSLVVQL